MKRLLTTIAGVAAITLISGGAALQAAGTLEGRWAAVLNTQGVNIPFRLDISGDGTTAVGTLYNGDDKELTTSAVIKDGKVQLNFDHYQTTLVATVKDGELDGKIDISRRGASRPGGALDEAPAPVTPAAGAKGGRAGGRAAGGSTFHAKRYVASSEVAANVPSIDGVWEIPHDSNKGEKAWRLIVQQKGSDITTTILRVDGDTGALTGGWQGGKFVASHFDGARPGLLEITPQADGTLKVVSAGSNRDGDLIAYRPEAARAKGFPEPANYQTHTTVKDPNEVFTYSFPDVNGKLVSNDDARYKNKVVLAIVTGTWCPNCHDEAQYLVQLYAKYHSQGLEIVALDFEEPEQQKSLSRVNAFIKQYKVPYQYLIAGEPAEMWDKVPQAVNLNTWPATLFIGRDGKVKATHAGFAAPGSGVFNQQLKDEFTSNIERLLNDKSGAPVSVASKAGF